MRTRLLVFCLALALILIAAQGSAGLWTGWEWLNPRPTGNDLQAVAVSDALIVAVGHHGTILVSEDGEDWEIVHGGWGLSLQDVIWTGEMFVAVGGRPNPDVYWCDLYHNDIVHGVILTSPDGRHWSEAFSPRWVVFHQVLFDGEQIVAVGYPGTTAISQDGVDWLEFTWPGYPMGEIFEVAWNGSIYVGIGNVEFDSMVDGRAYGSAVFFSEDAVTWNRVSPGDFESPSWGSVVWDGQQFSVFGFLAVLRSPDGIVWTETTTNLRGYLIEVIWTGVEYLAVGTDLEFSYSDIGGKIARSSDGQTWTMTEVLPCPFGLKDVVVFNGGAVVVGEYGSIVFSPDGEDPWTVVTSREHDLQPWAGVVRLGVAEGVLVAATSSMDLGLFLRSEDGRDWELVAEGPYRWNGIEIIEETFWAFASDARFATSQDGRTWDMRSTGNGNSWVATDIWDVATDGKVILLVGDNDWAGYGRARVEVSTDGHDWDAIDIDGARWIRSVVWSGSRFVAVGTDAVLRSEDGYQWEIELLQSDSDIGLTEIATNGSVLVAVGYEGHEGLVLISDDDGMTWQENRVERGVNSVTWTGEVFVAVGGGLIHTSRDGMRWFTSEFGVGGALGFVEGLGEEIFLSGNYGRIVKAKLMNFVPPREFESDPILD